MSECVVRMEMPSGCHDCKLRNMVGNCPIPMFGGQDEQKVWTLKECFERPPWCPIICSLPEGHGRLVDADDLKATHMFYHEVDNVSYAEERDIDDCSTIVPAERSET